MRPITFAVTTLVVALVCLGLAVYAWAAEVPPASAPGFWTLLAEPLALVIGALVTLALGWLTPRLARLIGQDEANKLQAALQAAANRAAGIAILKLSGRAFDLSRPLPAAETKMAIDAGVVYALPDGH